VRLALDEELKMIYRKYNRLGEQKEGLGSKKWQTYVLERKINKSRRYPDRVTSCFAEWRQDFYVLDFYVLVLVLAFKKSRFINRMPRILFRVDHN
jgi:hypothetical protein